MGVLDDHLAAIDAAIRDELERQAREVLEESNRNVPVGDPAEDPNLAESLVESGRVTMTDAPLTGPIAVISYDTPYAVRQHESFHLRHPRGGGPRFLENALLARARDVENGVAAAVRVTTAGGRQRRTRA
jgi:hypothetical protein